MNEKTHSACCTESTAQATACCEPSEVGGDCCAASKADTERSSHVSERAELHSAPATEGGCCTQ